MKWRGEFFVDLALPFGLRSAVLAFSSIADLLEWILKHKYCLNSLLHYMDDFQTLELAYLLKQYWHLCALVWRMGYPPFTQRNWRGPLIVWLYLGLSWIYLLFGPLFLDCINAVLDAWSTKNHRTRRELEYRVGNLTHACKVIPQGWTFFQHMIFLLYAFWRDHHPIRLNQEFRLDGKTFLGGVSFCFRGMASVFRSPLCGLPYRIFMFHATFI